MQSKSKNNLKPRNLKSDCSHCVQFKIAGNLTSKNQKQGCLLEKEGEWRHSFADKHVHEFQFV